MFAEVNLTPPPLLFLLFLIIILLHLHPTVIHITYASVIVQYIHTIPTLLINILTSNQGICAGRHTIAGYLVAEYGFTRLRIRSSSSGPDPDDSDAGGFFDSAEDLLDFVTQRWRERWVVDEIPSEAVLDLFARRPFFLLISVDAPVTTRWRRMVANPSPLSLLRLGGATSSSLSSSLDPDLTELDQFVAFSDRHLYGVTDGGQLPLMSRAAVRILNTSSSLSDLYGTVDKLDLLDPDRLRPSWDAYFMSLASLAAQRSNCMKRRVGCVVVRDRRVISTGYNGTPRGLLNCGEGGCGRCNAGQGSGEGLATCLCLHAEENALLEAGRERLREGAVLYCDTCPCLTCSIKIVQVGISEVVYSQEYSMDNRTATVLREGGVRLRQFVPVSSK